MMRGVNWHYRLRAVGIPPFLKVQPVKILIDDSYYDNDKCNDKANSQQYKKRVTHLVPAVKVFPESRKQARRH